MNYLKVASVAIAAIAFVGYANPQASASEFSRSEFNSMYTTVSSFEPLYPNSYQWCGEAGGSNCGFTSYQQCLESVQGLAGLCSPNRLYRKAI